MSVGLPSDSLLGLRKASGKFSPLPEGPFTITAFGIYKVAAPADVVSTQILPALVDLPNVDAINLETNNECLFTPDDLD